MENFYTIDIICHGALGKKLWADYRECCYSCKYANIQREGDITLGDFWEFENVMPTISTRWKIKAEDGVSLVRINFPKGKNCGIWYYQIKNDI